ncbi:MULTISPECIES: Hcp family type VI secretion system effector [Aliivibrio]|jgi:hypothetical protein|uniref:Type VI secretion system protein n=1 Tax=Aliivibrio sifiae TaxID=566293 RepID=A0A2S7X367_9GAMM|nr:MULTISPECIES: Hcp family type VI secretion system effector [Aliivibrio]OCH11434.1 hypothetical protein A6E11_01305 [Aliivibrio fischeri]PQJ84478.1 hypothetical protein BTO22_13190 [Aliivibrio sifiae]
MTTAAYLTINGEQQGPLSFDCNTPLSMGNSCQTSHKDEITVLSFSHSISYVNKSVHRPIQVIKKIDKSSPLLAQACTNSETLQCTLKFYRKSPDGSHQENFYEIHLTGAMIKNIQTEMPNVQHLGELEMTEVLDISYRDITWKHISANTNGYSSWMKAIDELAS